MTLYDHAKKCGLKAQRAQADAERYRWIRDKCEQWRIGKMLSAHRFDGKPLDAAIDAARCADD